MVSPITRFSLLPSVPDKPGRSDHAPLASPTPLSLQPAPFVVAGAVIGLTLFAVTAVVALGKGKPPLERQLIKLVNHLFPIGPRREWLLTGFPRYAYLPHLPSLPPDLAHLSSSSNPLNQRGIDAIGAAWYRALEHRYGNTIHFVLAARNPASHDELIPDVRRDQGNLRNLITLYRRLEKEGVFFSERQAIELDEATEVLDSIL